MQRQLKDFAVRLFWRLPHQQRRRLYRLAAPASYDTFQEMRHLDPAEGNSLRPFEEHGCLFIHIPKCAGIAIGRSLFGYTPGSHINALTYQLIYGQADYRRLFKFAFVRNPWDRTLSAYKFLKGGGLTADDARWAEAHLQPYPDFDSFVRGWLTRRNALSWQHFKPQHRFICNPQGELQVDFVGRFERLSADFDHIAARLGLTATLAHANRSRSSREPYQTYYTPRTRRIVADVYRQDIALFDFQFE